MLTDREVIYLWKHRGLPPIGMIQCLADLNGCQRGAMQERLIALGLITEDDYKTAQPGRTSSWTESELNTLIELKRKGRPLRIISKRIMRSTYTISNKINELRKAGVSL